MCPTPCFALMCVVHIRGHGTVHQGTLHGTPQAGCMHNEGPPCCTIARHLVHCPHTFSFVYLNAPTQLLSPGASTTSRTSSWSRFTSQISSTCIPGPVQPLTCSLDPGGTLMWSAGSSMAHYPPAPGRNRTAGLLWFCLVRPFRSKLLIATVQHSMFLFIHVAVRENEGTCSRSNKPLRNQLVWPSFLLSCKEVWAIIRH